VCRKEFSLHRDQLSRSIIPYVNAARSVVTDTSHLVVIFVAVLVVVDLLAAVVWIYLKRSPSSNSFSLSLSLSLSLSCSLSSPLSVFLLVIVCCDSVR